MRVLVDDELLEQRVDKAVLVLVELPAPLVLVGRRAREVAFRDLQTDLVDVDLALRPRAVRLRTIRRGVCGTHQSRRREAACLCSVVERQELRCVADDARQPAAPPRPPPGRRRGIFAVAASLPIALLSGQFSFFLQMVYFSNWREII